MSNRISPGPGQPYLTCPSCELEQVWQDVNYQCDGNPNNPSGMNGHMDARGVTYWRGDTNQYTLSPNNEYGTNQYSQASDRFYDFEGQKRSHLLPNTFTILTANANLRHN